MARSLPPPSTSSELALNHALSAAEGAVKGQAPRRCARYLSQGCRLQLADAVSLHRAAAGTAARGCTGTTHGGMILPASRPFLTKSGLSGRMSSCYVVYRRGTKTASVFLSRRCGARPSFIWPARVSLSAMWLKCSRWLRRRGNAEPHFCVHQSFSRRVWKSHGCTSPDCV